MAKQRLTATERGYDRKWHKARTRFLAEHPLCAMCMELGIVRQATVVDHIVPHRGNPELFWDRSNWQALCRHCHDSVKKRMEQGTPVGCGVDGWPTDPSHPWIAGWREGEGGGKS